MLQQSTPYPLLKPRSVFDIVRPEMLLLLLSNVFLYFYCATHFTIATIILYRRLNVEHRDNVILVNVISLLSDLKR